MNSHAETAGNCSVGIVWEGQIPVGFCHFELCNIQGCGMSDRKNGVGRNEWNSAVRVARLACNHSAERITIYPSCSS